MNQMIAISNLTCAVICAKWALDLGFTQIRQIIFLIGGLFFGPIMLLILYIFLVNNARKQGKSGGNVW